MRAILMLCLLSWGLLAQQPHDMTLGKWQRENTFKSPNKTIVHQKELLELKSDHTFVWRFVIDLKKKEHFVKGLEVEATGIWKRYVTTLVLVLQHQKTPFAKEVSNSINPASLQALARTYQAPFQGSPIRVNTITYLDKQKLTFTNEKGEKISYTKGKPTPPPKPKR